MAQFRMMPWFNKLASFLFFDLALACLLILAQVALLYQFDRPWFEIKVITGDGLGYCDYLTSVFIDLDLTNQAIDGRYIMDYEGRGVNKYYAGTAILMLPFFLIGMLISWLINAPIDGISAPFQWAMCLAALSYVLLGLRFLRLLLLSYDVPLKSIQFLAFTLVFGTNLFYYSALDLTASHVYSFFAISGFSWYVRKTVADKSPRVWLWAAAFLALVVLIRPVNSIILLFVPFLLGPAKLRDIIDVVKNFLAIPKPAFIIFFALIAIQPLLYYLQSGKWIVWSYVNEGFYFSDPKWALFLFSFKRGWFLYSPFFLLLFPACYALFSKLRWPIIVFVSAFMVLIFVLSSWWSWHYGGSYGSRPMIDFYSILILPIGIWLSQLREQWKKTTLVAFALLCILMTVIQVYQIKAEIISAWHMNKGKYIWSLGKVSSEHRERMGGRLDLPPYHKQETIIYTGSSGSLASDKRSSFRHAKESTSREQAAIFNGNVEYNVQFNYRFIAPDNGKIFLKMALDRLENERNAASSAFVVIELRNALDSLKVYDAFLVNEYPDMAVNQWTRWHYEYAIPKNTEEGDLLKIYLWNKGKKSFLVKDVQIDLIKLE